MWGSIQRELSGLLDALHAHGVQGVDKLREEAREVLGDVHKTNERTAIHNAHTILSDVMRQAVNEIPQFANYLFGSETAGKVSIVEQCVDAGPSASVRLTPNVGTHDVLVSITRVPKDRTDAVSLDHVERAMGALDDRRIALERATRMAEDIGLTDELGESLSDDAETFALVSECLLFLRQLLAAENSRAN